MSSRSLDDLRPEVAEKAKKFLSLCRAKGINVIVTDTLRTFKEQDDLYAQGRTKPGFEVTKARAGYSWHNFGRAFDVVVIIDGKAQYKLPFVFWEIVGQIGESVGLEWGGRWTMEREGIIDLPHFEDRGGMTLAEAREKEMPKEFDV
jgi:peptidoglycan LD-endopeptidase CwlK